MFTIWFCSFENTYFWIFLFFLISWMVIYEWCSKLYYFFLLFFNDMHEWMLYIFFYLILFGYSLNDNLCLNVLFFKKSMNKFSKENLCSKMFFFFINILRKMYLQKKSMTMYVQKFFFQKTYVQKFWYMYKISKDNEFTNFQRRVYLQKILFFLSKIVHVYMFESFFY